MKEIKSIIVFTNLNVAAFDVNGEQVPELQKSVAQLIAENMKKHGYDPEGTLLETVDGNWRLYRCENGWNRRRA